MGIAPRTRTVWLTDEARLPPRENPSKLILLLEGN